MLWQCVQGSWAEQVENQEKEEEQNKLAAEKDAEDDGPPPGLEGGLNGGPTVSAVAEAIASVHVDDEVDSGQATVTTRDESMYTSASTFEELGLSQELLQGLYTEMKFERPSRIQAKTLPMILEKPHKSLIAQAHNGSGKTTCFTLAMLSRVDPRLKAPQALCLCPTRELVVQNLSVLERMGKFTGITLASTAEQSTPGNRRRKVEEQVVVGTHGKLKDWISRRMLQTKNMRILVFDEADEMLKVSFKSDLWS